MANEKRLIDANALLEEIGDIEVRNYAETSYQFIHDFVAFIEGVCKRIKNAPTVDAVEVVHGHWIFHKVTRYVLWDESFYECSNCGSRNPLFNFNYCPNCGAKMDGESQ